MPSDCTEPQSDSGFRWENPDSAFVRANVEPGHPSLGTEPQNDARPCMADGCRLPGRFILGLDEGTTTCWCIEHVMPRGGEWLGGLVQAIRETIDRG